MDDLHLVARDVDQLVVLRLQRTHVQEAVLGELVQHDQPFAVGLLGLAHGGMQVAGLVVDIQLLDDRIDLLALEGADRLVDVPLHHLAVQEQGGVGVATAVIGGVERPETQLRLRDHHVARLDLVVEQIVQPAHVQHRHGRRQLAVDRHVDAVGGGVDAVRAVGDRDIAGIGRAMAAIDDRHAVDDFDLAVLHRLLDALDVEDDHPVLFLGGHLGGRDAFFRVVAGREDVFALIVGVGVVQVAVHPDLPRDLHRVAVDGGEVRAVLLRLVQDLAVIGRGHALLAVGEDIAGARILLKAQAMDRRGVGDLDDLVGLHDVAADAGDAAVGLVVAEDVAAVIGAVGERHVRVVQVAVLVDAAARLQELAGVLRQTLRQDLKALVGLSPAGGAAPGEDRDAHQLAHRRRAHDPHFAGVPAAVEHVVFVEVAGLHLGALLAAAGGGMGRCRTSTESAGRYDGGAADGAGQAGQRRHFGGAAQQVAAVDARRFFILITHRFSPSG